MRNLLGTSLLMLGLIACSSEKTPTPEKVSHNLQAVPDDKVVAVISEKTHKAPEAGQIVDETVAYKTVDNIYDAQGAELLIPRGTVISGNYINDGVSCVIVWKAAYANSHEYKNKHGTFSLSDIAKSSRCDPVKGLKVGSHVFIKFNTWENWFPQH